MVKQIIKIDENKCVGCGLCASACQQGAIGIVDGKAKLLRDDYCDGLGKCLPVCPVGAIDLVKQEMDGLNKDTEQVIQKQSVNQMPQENLVSGCPGTRAKKVQQRERESKQENDQKMETYLNQWPVQIKLVPVNAPYFNNANLLVAADCTAYAYGNFHSEYMKNRITIIGCPKLDEGDYSQKLTDILSTNEIKSVTIVRMEVPCCGGLEQAVKTALKNCGKMIPWQVVVISTDGSILDN